VSRRHTAALAFVGWYLLLPPRGWRPEDLAKPLGQRQGSIPLLESPYSEWSIQKTFDSARECEALKQEFWSDPGREYAICITSDDPRLKGN
jgi:hypothetical protein